MPVRAASRKGEWLGSQQCLKRALRVLLNGPNAPLQGMPREKSRAAGVAALNEHAREGESWQAVCDVHGDQRVFAVV